MEEEEKIQYWITSSDADFVAMKDMYETGNYTWTLFIGHLVIEKLLKGYYLKELGIQPPFSHNLLLLAEKTNLVLDDEQKNFLDTVTNFNIQARYDGYKQDFYKICTKEFTLKWVNEIEEFSSWIKNKL